MKEEIYIGTKIKSELHGLLALRAKKNARSISSEMRVILERALCSGRTRKKL